jgi:hypothetical protein
MAIDTRIKRASVTSFLLPAYGMGATPQAGFSVAEKQSVLWTYAGISSGPAVAAAATAEGSMWQILAPTHMHGR